VPTAIAEKVATPIAVQVPEAKSAAEGVFPLGHEIGLGSRDPVERQGFPTGLGFGGRRNGKDHPEHSDSGNDA
jgi:hypothetical protein